MLLVLVVTLAPGQDEGPVAFCLLCAQGAMSGFLLNIVLFVPLGMVLRWPGHRAWRVVAGGAGLSAAIEVAQAIIPGRFASMDDLLANTIGTALGVMLFADLDGLLNPPPAVRPRLALSAVALAVLAQLLGALLVRPALSESDYAAWYGPRSAPQLDPPEPFAGHLIYVWFDARPVHSSRWSNIQKASSRLLGGARIEVAVVAARMPERPEPVFGIGDENQKVNLEVLIHRSTAMLRYRTVAEQLRLTPPQLWFFDAMRGVQPTDTVRLGLWRERARWCFASPQAGGCRGFSAGALWRMLAPSGFPDVLLIDALWMAALFLPVGYWVSQRGAFGWAALAILPAVLLPLAGAWIVLSPYPVLGAAAGTLAGRLIAIRRARRTPSEGL